MDAVLPTAIEISCLPQQSCRITDKEPMCEYSLLFVRDEDAPPTPRLNYSKILLISGLCSLVCVTVMAPSVPFSCPRRVVGPSLSCQRHANGIRSRPTAVEMYYSFTAALRTSTALYLRSKQNMKAKTYVYLLIYDIPGMILRSCFLLGAAWCRPTHSQ